MSCIYGIGNPEAFQDNIIKVKVGDLISRNKFLLELVQALYARTESDFQRGNFRVKGDAVDIYPGYADIAYRVYFFGDEIETIESFDPIDGNTIEEFDYLNIFPASIFNTTKDSMQNAIHEIQDDMVKQIEYYIFYYFYSRCF